ncbi:hypothetical protein B0H17DRAFT_1133135 [Mycena rosella]|uniref:Uncharacterized protein n=1 Tax=Mycena rosella TaxID=1033263 RepID=A0AAD7GFL4_MYCRO|nr:hypothetical protein B0H17DRAFT_1133135 [Mycena rosella]
MGGALSPLEDSEENLVTGWGSVWASESSSPLPGGSRIPAGWDDEFVRSSQPFNDGEEGLKGPLISKLQASHLTPWDGPHPHPIPPLEPLPMPPLALLAPGHQLLEFGKQQ